jgi:hypothetical protein
MYGSGVMKLYVDVLTRCINVETRPADYNELYCMRDDIMMPVRMDKFLILQLYYLFRSYAVQH